MVEATIEDLAITIRSLRVAIWGRPHIVGEDALLRAKRSNPRGLLRRITPRNDGVATSFMSRLGVNKRSSAAAEKGDEGMALKIFTEAKPFLKAYMKPFDITETRMLTNEC